MPTLIPTPEPVSRSNPYKKKPRTTRATAQIVVEGFTEEAFCKYLKSLYARDCGVGVEIHNARGGSPTDIVRSALKRKGFDRTFLVYDTDVSLPKSWAAKSQAAKQIAVTSTPCIEALFLELLAAPIPTTSSSCKKAFSKHLSDTEKFLPKSYAKIFFRRVLNSERTPFARPAPLSFQQIELGQS